MNESKPDYIVLLEHAVSDMVDHINAACQQCKSGGYDIDLGGDCPNCPLCCYSTGGGK